MVLDSKFDLIYKTNKLRFIRPLYKTQINLFFHNLFINSLASFGVSFHSPHHQGLQDWSRLYLSIPNPQLIRCVFYGSLIHQRIGYKSEPYLKHLRRYAKFIRRSCKHLHEICSKKISIKNCIKSGHFVSRYILNLYINVEGVLIFLLIFFYLKIFKINLIRYSNN